MPLINCNNNLFFMLTFLNMRFRAILARLLYCVSATKKVGSRQDICSIICFDTINYFFFLFFLVRQLVKGRESYLGY